MDGLALLEHLTNNLPRLDPLTFSSGPNNYVIYDVAVGEIKARNLMNINGIAVADCSIAKGSASKKHEHEEREWFIVYEGDVQIEFDEIDSLDIKRLKIEGSNAYLFAGDYIYVPENTPHIFKSSGGARYAAITVPSSGALPK